METALANLEKTYKIEKELGAGGMGIVYLATDQRLDRRVAIKVLKLSKDNVESGVSIDEVIERFLREAKAVAKLTHPNIVSIYDIGNEQGLYYMVMEFVDGKVLSNMVTENGINQPDLIINLGIQICNALDFAHENGIVHRDIKPANIILSRKGIAKLMDFGIASLSNQKEAYKLTQAGSVLGSIMYISPEQLNNASNVDARADIYSLGISLYEMLTGNLPFMGENISSIIMKILTENPEPPSTFNPKVSEALDRIILKSIAKAVEDRYQSANDMARDLSRLLSGDAAFAATSTLSSFFDNEEALKPISTSSTVILNTRVAEPPPQNSGTVLFNPRTNSLTSMQASAKKTVINETLIKSLEKDYLWIQKLFAEWETDNLSDLSLADVIAKVTDRSSYNKLFTGLIVIDKNIYIFAYEGYFIGAINLKEGIYNEDVFSSLPEIPESIQLKTPDENNKHTPVIISSLFNYEKPFHINLDSSTIDLIPLIDNFSSEQSQFSGFVKCYTESNIIYYGYSLGQPIFACPVDSDDDSLEPEVYSDLKKLVLSQGVLLNSYTIKPALIGPSIPLVLKQALVSMKYRSHAKATLYKVVEQGTEEVANFLLRETKQNVYLDLSMLNNDKIKILDKDLDPMKIVTESICYKFSEWFINDYFYQINTTGNTIGLKMMYSWIPAIENIKFFEMLKDEEGNSYEFAISTHGHPKGENGKKILCLIHIGRGEKKEINKFIDDVSQIKKSLIKSGDIGGAIYISTTPYPPESLKLFYERAGEPKKSFLPSLDASSKYRGFVKLAYGKGFHLNLVEFNDHDNSFKVIAPNLG